MNALDKLFYLGKVLQAGESLKDPARWKNKQLVLTNVLVILGAVPLFTNLEISQSDLSAIGYGITVLLGVLNSYFTVATSDKIGVQVKSKNKDS